jgi:hypothetical protein
MNAGMVSDDARTIARALLEYIGAPPGAVNVLVRGETRPHLIVRLAPGLRIPQNRLPEYFRGVRVKYERRHIVRPR